jgi:hypothetical protein
MYKGLKRGGYSILLAIGISGVANADADGPNLTCVRQPDGSMLTLGVRVIQGGVTITTTTLGTTEIFKGGSFLISPNLPTMSTPVDSANLGQDGLSGSAAKIGKQNQESCHARPHANATTGRLLARLLL